MKEMSLLSDGKDIFAVEKVANFFAFYLKRKGKFKNHVAAVCTENIEDLKILKQFLYNYNQFGCVEIFADDGKKILLFERNEENPTVRITLFATAGSVDRKAPTYFIITKKEAKSLAKGIEQNIK